MKDLLTPKVRAWLYSIVGATTPLLVTLGIIDNTVAGHIIAISSAILALGTNALALANVPKASE